MSWKLSDLIGNLIGANWALDEELEAFEAKKVNIKDLKSQKVAIHVTLNEEGDDLANLLLNAEVIPSISFTALYNQLGIRDRILTLDDLEKTRAFFKRAEQPSVVMESNNLFTKEFDFDIGSLSDSEKNILLYKWEYKVLLKSLLDWIDKKIAEEIECIYFYSNATEKASVHCISLMNRDRLSIYEIIVRIIESFAQKLPKRSWGKAGTFGWKPLAGRRLSTPGRNFRLKEVKERIMEYQATGGKRANRTRKAKLWVKGQLIPTSYVAKKEIEVIDKLSNFIGHIETLEEISPKKVGRGAKSREELDLTEFFNEMRNRQIYIRIGTGQELHDLLNNGEKAGKPADLILNSEIDLISAKNRNSHPFLKIKKRLKRIRKRSRIIELTTQEIEVIERRISDAIQYNSHSIGRMNSWKNEQFLSIILNYIITRRLKKLSKRKNNIFKEIGEIFEDAFSENPKRYLWIQAFGIGEVFGPRTPGKESHWIIDHVAVFKINQGHPDEGNYILVWINDKQIDTIQSACNHFLISKDLRNQYNLMIMNLENSKGHWLIRSGSKRPITNFSHNLEYGNEKNAWTMINKLMREGKVISQYALYSCFSVKERSSNKGEIGFADIFVYLQAFQPKGAKLLQIIERKSANSRLKGAADNLKQKLATYDLILRKNRCIPASNRIIWPIISGNQKRYLWSKIIANIKRDVERYSSRNH